MFEQKVIRVEQQIVDQVTEAIPSSEAVFAFDKAGESYWLVLLPDGWSCKQAEKIVHKLTHPPVNQTPPKPKLTGLHALLCPDLEYTGFKMFSSDRINLVTSVTHCGSFTDPSANPNIAAKKAKGLLSLSFDFHIDRSPTFYRFEIYINHSAINDEVWGWWYKLSDTNTIIGDYPIWTAIQQFEKYVQKKHGTK